MGATTYITQANGVNVKDVFNNLVNDAIYEYGHDAYNGTISTTSLSADLTDKVPAKILKNEEKLRDFIEENDELFFPNKWETTYINLGVAHYKAFTPEWVDDKRTPKREKGVTTIQRFTVYGKFIQEEFTKLTDAKRRAKEYVLEKKENVEIYKHRSNGDKFLLGHMTLTSDGKEYKSARKAKTKVYAPINKFLFFVYASC